MALLDFIIGLLVFLLVLWLVKMWYDDKHKDEDSDESGWFGNRTKPKDSSKTSSTKSSTKSGTRPTGRTVSKPSTSSVKYGTSDPHAQTPERMLHVENVPMATRSELLMDRKVRFGVLYGPSDEVKRPPLFQPIPNEIVLAEGDPKPSAVPGVRLPVSAEYDPAEGERIRKKTTVDLFNMRNNDPETMKRYLASRNARPMLIRDETFSSLRQRREDGVPSLSYSIHHPHANPQTWSRYNPNLAYYDKIDRPNYTPIESVANQRI